MKKYLLILVICCSFNSCYSQKINSTSEIELNVLSNKNDYIHLIEINYKENFIPKTAMRVYCIVGNISKEDCNVTKTSYKMQSPNKKESKGIEMISFSRDKIILDVSKSELKNINILVLDFADHNTHSSEPLRYKNSDYLLGQCSDRK